MMLRRLDRLAVLVGLVVLFPHHLIAAGRPEAMPRQADAVQDGEDILSARRIAFPVPAVARAALRDSFFDGRPGHLHEAIDIAAGRGTPVYAVDDGTVAKLFASGSGGLTVYQFEPQHRLAYYYAHLDRYADGLREGGRVRRCDLLGYVGTSGNAQEDAPHLHFGVHRLGPERQWWKGAPLDPFRALQAAAGTSADRGGGDGTERRSCPR